jgi:hypothetical protein
MAGDDAFGDTNTGCSAQNSEDFSAMATFRRLERLQDYAKKNIKDRTKKVPKYEYDKPIKPSGRLDTQLFPGIDRNPKKVEETD